MRPRALLALVPLALGAGGCGGGEASAPPSVTEGPFTQRLASVEQALEPLGRPSRTSGALDVRPRPRRSAGVRLDDGARLRVLVYGDTTSALRAYGDLRDHGDRPVMVHHNVVLVLPRHPTALSRRAARAVRALGAS
jgi:hypothetical protein